MRILTALAWLVLSLCHANAAQLDLARIKTTVNLAQYEPGTIVVSHRERRLFYKMPDGNAIAYPVAVARESLRWSGKATVSLKKEWPEWTPPKEMLVRRPDLPVHMAGGADNPLGARALYLFQGTRDTLYRIHGSNEPDSIGFPVSSGCIRMTNMDVIELYSKVRLGTQVVMLP